VHSALSRTAGITLALCSYNRKANQNLPVHREIHNNPFSGNIAHTPAELPTLLQQQVEACTVRKLELCTHNVPITQQAPESTLYRLTWFYRTSDYL